MAEYISMIWDGGDPDFEITTGHITQTEFRSILSSEGIPTCDLNQVEHKWARWIPVIGRDYDMMLKLSKRGRGAFPVTVSWC